VVGSRSGGVERRTEIETVVATVANDALERGPGAALGGERRGDRLAFEDGGSERRTGFSSEA